MQIALPVLANPLDQVQSVLHMLRPAMQADGGNVEVVSIKDGVISVRFCGMCVACPSQKLTLKQGIERTLKEHLPWVQEVIKATS